MTRSRSTTPDRLLICSDLDRTLIPNGPQPESPTARRRFHALAERPQVTLCYVSGRHRELIEQALCDHGLPAPDFVIGDVGTTVYRVGNRGSWLPLKAWQDQIASDWRGTGRALIERRLTTVHGLQPQETEKQNRFKLSYYMDPEAWSEAFARDLQATLASLGVRTRLVYSVDDVTGSGLLDVLPECASKLHAIRFLMIAEQFELPCTVFCGDSGNDLEVLVSEVASVLVSNANQDVEQAARQGSAANGYADRLYLATGGFLGMNGNYAAGVLEGIAHFHPHIAAWLGEPEHKR